MTVLDDPSRVPRRAVLGAIVGAVGATMVGGSGAAGRAAPDRFATPEEKGSAPRRATAAQSEIAVIGAGAFGTWIAWHLQRQGHEVLLMDAWGPAHARASSGGESRMTRTTYGADELYTSMAWDSLEDWRWLSQRSGLPVFHQTGVLFFFGKPEPYYVGSIEVHKRLRLPLEVLDRSALSRRFPQINFDGIEHGLFEHDLGVLMARRGVQTLVQEFVRAGGEYRQLAALPPKKTDSDRLAALGTATGEMVHAERYIFAGGPWLPKLFPDILGSRIFPTRQEVFFFAPEPGDTRFGPAQLPGWADFNNGDLFYGMPDLETRGAKVAHDQHGPPIDPDTGDRTPTAAALQEVREYMAMRFPALAKRPLTESRVCQYENSSNGDLLIDQHPTMKNVWLVGGGSGHGFKHAPAVGKYTADLVMGRQHQPEPRFSLATKAEQQKRDVH